MSTKKQLSEVHEDHLAEVLPGASKTAASGSRRESHDIRTLVNEVNEWWRFRYEAKCTQFASYSFKRGEWTRLKEDVYSSSAQERPAWAVRFYGADETVVLDDVVVVDLNDWVELLEELEQLRGRAKQVPPTS